MLRRQFIHRATIAMISSALPKLAFPNVTSWKESFASALKKKPWLLAFRSVEAQNFASPAQVSGTIPEDLRGTLYRNGPARHEIGDFRYHHWFDGDGMIQAWRFGEQGISHQGRMIETRKYLAEIDAGRALYPGFATVPPNPKMVTSPDSVNVANISVLPLNGRLYALWEAGSPWEIDPDTLATKGLHRFSPDTEGLPFSAHPRIEPDGTLWNFGYVSAAKKLVFWHISATGKLVKAGLVDCDPISTPHDFVVTARHLVLFVPPLHFEPEKVTQAGPTTFLDAHQWHPERPTRVLVVDKSDFSKYRFLELPAQWVFHFGNAWEDRSGIIRLDAARAPDPLAMLASFRDIMRGEITPSTDAHHTSYRIDLNKGTVSEAAMLDTGISSEFPVIDPRVSGRRYSRLVMLTRQGKSNHEMLNAVSSFNMNTGVLDSFRYPDTLIPEEHLYVPKPGSAPEADGWVIGSALDYQHERMTLSIFDAAHLADGPLATATVPYALPMGLHGKFV